MDSPPAPNPCFVWIRDAASRLGAIGAGAPRLEAEYLMATALGIPRIELWLREDPPTEEEIARFDTLLLRRLAREPLQYVLGTVEFADLTLEIGPGVFIPRNETEILVERVETSLGARGESCLSAVRIIDVGAGSGAILLALLSRIPTARGIGIDSSPAALEWAERNAKRLELTDRVEFLENDLLDGLPSGSADAVVSNPPYIALEEADSLAPEVREHEPPEALFGGKDGLDAIERIVPQAADVLVPGGLLALEISITQEDRVRRLLPAPTWTKVCVCPDLSGRPRVVLARLGVSGPASDG